MARSFLSRLTAEALGVYVDISKARGKVVAVDMAGLDPADATGGDGPDGDALRERDAMAQNRRALRPDPPRGDRRLKAIGGAPFGYSFKTRHRRATVPASLTPGLSSTRTERRIVRELFERRRRARLGWNWRVGCDQVAPKASQGRWARSTVSSMVACPTYTGQVHHGEHVRTDAHEPIVTPPLWRRRRTARRRTPRGSYLLSALPVAPVVTSASWLDQGRACAGRTAIPPRVYTCDTAGCEAGRQRRGSTRRGGRASVVRRPRRLPRPAVDDSELEDARKTVAGMLVPGRDFAAVVPSHPTAIAKHQAALEAAEQAWSMPRIAFTSSPHPDREGPNVHELRRDWPSLTLTERREILRAGVDAVSFGELRHPLPSLPPLIALRPLSWRCS